MTTNRWMKRSGAAFAAASVVSFTPALAQAEVNQAPSALDGNLARKVAFAPAKLPLTPAPKAMSYQVKSGDTLGAIAARTGVSVAEIAKANNISNPNLIFPGQHLRIPMPGAVNEAPKANAPKKTARTPKPAKTTTPARSTASSYTVKSGDTLGAIAHRFGTTISAIARDNGIKNTSLIFPGQKLTIGGKAAPAPAQSAPAPAPKAKPSTSAPKPSNASAPVATRQSYTVKSGDTLGAIARQFNTSVSAIARANGIANTGLIFPGQKLTISGTASPKATTTAPSKKAPAPAPKAVASTAKNYTVQAGDTLGGIAAKFNTTVSALVKANGISNAGLIFPGQKLNVGGTASAPATPVAPKQLVQNNFPGYTYPDATVAAANVNKNTLVRQSVPTRAEVQSMVVATARQMGVDPKLALAHAYVESGFDATAVSPANAIGTMQVIPSSGRWASSMVGRELNLLDPQDNIVAGVAIIRSLQNSAKNRDEGIAGYYQGLGGVQRYGMRPDTVHYVAKVNAAMQRF